MWTTLAVYLHAINPIAVPLWPGGGIRWYGLSYLVGFLLAWLIIRRACRVGITTLKPEQAGDLIITLAFGAVIGGRLGYVFFYRLDLLWTFSAIALPFWPHHLPLWGVLAINEGGMASHGGMIGVLLAGLIYARRHGHNWGHLLDLAALGAPPGLLLGRIANFINGELFGRPCAPNFPLAVKFPQEMLTWERLHPEKLELLGPIVKYLPTYSPSAPYPLADYVPALLQQVQHGNPVIAKMVEPILTPRHPSQLYEALGEGLILWTVLLLVWLRPRKPWVLGGWFLAAYAVLRITCEFFREPDAHIANEEFAHWHITRGQELSILIFLAGVLLIVWANRRKIAPMGGWTKHTL